MSGRRYLLQTPKAGSGLGLLGAAPPGYETKPKSLGMPSAASGHLSSRVFVANVPVNSVERLQLHARFSKYGIVTGCELTKHGNKLGPTRHPHPLKEIFICKMDETSQGEGHNMLLAQSQEIARDGISQHDRGTGWPNAEKGEEDSWHNYPKENRDIKKEDWDVQMQNTTPPSPTMPPQPPTTPPPLLPKQDHILTLGLFINKKLKPAAKSKLVPFKKSPKTKEGSSNSLADDESVSNAGSLNLTSFHEFSLRHDSSVLPPPEEGPFQELWDNPTSLQCDTNNAFTSGNWEEVWEDEAPSSLHTTSSINSPHSVEVNQSSVPFKSPVQVEVPVGIFQDKHADASLEPLWSDNNNELSCISQYLSGGEASTTTEQKLIHVEVPVAVLKTNSVSSDELTSPVFQSIVQDEVMWEEEIDVLNISDHSDLSLDAKGGIKDGASLDDMANVCLQQAIVSSSASTHQDSQMLSAESTVQDSFTNGHSGKEPLGLLGSLSDLKTKSHDVQIPLQDQRDHSEANSLLWNDTKSISLARISSKDISLKTSTVPVTNLQSPMCAVTLEIPGQNVTSFTCVSHSLHSLSQLEKPLDPTSGQHSNSMLNTLGPTSGQHSNSMESTLDPTTGDHPKSMQKTPDSIFGQYSNPMQSTLGPTSGQDSNSLQSTLDSTAGQHSNSLHSNLDLTSGDHPKSMQKTPDSIFGQHSNLKQSTPDPTSGQVSNLMQNTVDATSGQRSNSKTNSVNTQPVSSFESCIQMPLAAMKLLDKPGVQVQPRYVQPDPAMSSIQPNFMVPIGPPPIAPTSIQHQTRPPLMGPPVDSQHQIIQMTSVPPPVMLPAVSQNVTYCNVYPPRPVGGIMSYQPLFQHGRPIQPSPPISPAPVSPGPNRQQAVYNSRYMQQNANSLYSSGLSPAPVSNRHQLAQSMPSPPAYMPALAGLPGVPIQQVQPMNEAQPSPHVSQSGSSHPATPPPASCQQAQPPPPGQFVQNESKKPSAYMPSSHPHRSNLKNPTMSASALLDPQQGFQDSSFPLTDIEKAKINSEFTQALQAAEGPLEVTDNTLLRIFMVMPEPIRRGIKRMGGLKPYFQQSQVFQVRGDMVSLPGQMKGDLWKPPPGRYQPRKSSHLSYKATEFVPGLSSPDRRSSSSGRLQSQETTYNSTRSNLECVPDTSRWNATTKSRHASLPDRVKASSLLPFSFIATSPAALDSAACDFYDPHDPYDSYHPQADIGEQPSVDSNFADLKEERTVFKLITDAPVKDDLWELDSFLTEAYGGGYYQDFIKISEELEKQNKEATKQTPSQMRRNIELQSQDRISQKSIQSAATSGLSKAMPKHSAQPEIDKCMSSNTSRPENKEYCKSNKKGAAVQDATLQSISTIEKSQVVTTERLDVQQKSPTVSSGMSQNMYAARVIGSKKLETKTATTFAAKLLESATKNSEKTPDYTDKNIASGQKLGESQKIVAVTAEGLLAKKQDQMVEASKRELKGLYDCQDQCSGVNNERKTKKEYIEDDLESCESWSTISSPERPSKKDLVDIFLIQELCTKAAIDSPFHTNKSSTKKLNQSSKPGNNGKLAVKGDSNSNITVEDCCADTATLKTNRIKVKCAAFFADSHNEVPENTMENSLSSEKLLVDSDSVSTSNAARIPVTDKSCVASQSTSLTDFLDDPPDMLDAITNADTENISNTKTSANVEKMEGAKISLVPSQECTADLNAQTKNTELFLTDSQDGATDIYAVDVQTEKIADDEQSLADTEQSLADTEQPSADTEQSLFDTEQPSADTEQSLVDIEQSLVDTEQSLADTEQSLADTQQSLADTEQLLADTEQPSGDTAQSLVDTEQSSADTEQSLVDTEQSLADMEPSLADTEQSLADTEQSLADTEQSLADTEQLLADTQKSLSDTEQSLADTEQSLFDTEQLLADTEQSLADTEQPSADTEQSLADTEQPSADTEQSVVDIEQSLADTEQSLADTEQSLADTEQSLADTQQSLADTELSLADTEQLLADTEQPFTNTEQSLADFKQSDTEQSSANFLDIVFDINNYVQLEKTTDMEEHFEHSQGDANVQSDEEPFCKKSVEQLDAKAKCITTEAITSESDHDTETNEASIAIIPDLASLEEMPDSIVTDPSVKNIHNDSFAKCIQEDSGVTDIRDRVDQDASLKCQETFNDKSSWSNNQEEVIAQPGVAINISADKEFKVASIGNFGDYSTSVPQVTKKPNKSNSVSVAVNTDNVRTVHKGIVTTKVPKMSRVTNTVVVNTASRCVGTFEDFQKSYQQKNIELESIVRLLEESLETERDQRTVQKHSYHAEIRTLTDSLEAVTKQKNEMEEQLKMKRRQQVVELRKTSAELRDTDARFSAQKTKVQSLEKENYCITKELSIVTRELFDLQATLAKETIRNGVSSVDDGTSTCELEEVQRDVETAKENKVLALEERAKAAERKVLKMQLESCQQSLYKTQQQGQYTYNVFVNSPQISTHEKLFLNTQWTSYQSQVQKAIHKLLLDYEESKSLLKKGKPLAELSPLQVPHVDAFTPRTSMPPSASKGHKNSVSTAQGLASVAISSGLVDDGTSVSSQASATMETVADAGLEELKSMTSKLLQPNSDFDKPTPSIPNIAGSAPMFSLSSIYGQQQPSGTHHPYNRESREARLRSIQRRLGLNPDTGKPLVAKTLDTDCAATSDQSSNLPNASSQLGSDNTHSFTMKQRNFASMYRKRMQSSSSDGDTTISSMIPKQDVASADLPPSGDRESSVHAIPPARLLGSQTKSALCQPEVGTNPPDERLNPLEASVDELENDANIAQSSDNVMDASLFEAIQFRYQDYRNSPTNETSTVETSPLEPIKSVPESAISQTELLRPSDQTSNQLTSNVPISIDTQQPLLAEQPRQLSSDRQRYDSTSMQQKNENSTQEENSVSSDNRQQSSPNKPDPAQYDQILGKFSFRKILSSDSSSVDESSKPDASTAATSDAASMRQFPKSDAIKAARSTSPAEQLEDTWSNLPPRLKARLGPRLARSGVTTLKPLGKSKEAKETNSSRSGFSWDEVMGGARKGVQKTSATIVGKAAGALSPFDGIEDDGWTTVLKKKKKSLDIADQRQVLPKSSSKAPGGGSLDKIHSALARQFSGITRKEVADTLKQVRIDHCGTLSGVSMAVIVKEASSHIKNTNSKYMEPKPSAHKETLKRYGCKGFCELHDESADMCVICQDDLRVVPGGSARGKSNSPPSKIRMLDCGHMFHDDCIKLWYSTRERTCPMCRCHTLLPEDYPRLI